MKKIVFFSHGLSANGIETFLVNVLRKIDKTKYDITVIIAIDEGVYCLHEKTVADMGIRVIHAGDLDAPKKKLDYIKNVKKILACCDCFLMPSLFEGLPFSLIEAQAAGLRCIVSDVVTKEADVGLIEYFSLENGAKKWAEFINRELDEPRKSADENKLRQFDISHTVRQLEEIYDR